MADITGDWRAGLRDARRNLRISQRALAERARVSVDAVRKYESGGRSPRREQLKALLDALQLDRAWRNRILFDAGFAPDGLDQRPANIDEWWLSPQEAAAEVDRYEWPAFVLSERGEVMHANAVAQAVWGVDLRTEFLDPVERNIMSIASNPRFADRCLNWEDAMAVIAKMFKNFHRAPEQFETPTPYFAALLQHFLAGDPKYVGRLAAIWQNTPEHVQYKIRATYPIVWDQPGIGVLRFRCLWSTASEVDGIGIHDWVPMDGATAVALDRLMQRGNAK